MKTIWAMTCREEFCRATIAAFATLSLLALGACAETGNTMRSELAPPPPFTVAQNEIYGPPAPVRLAKIDLNTIEPAAGAGEPLPPAANCLHASFDGASVNPVGFHWGDRRIGLDFTKSHSLNDTQKPGVLLTLTVPLSHGVKAKTGCPD